MIPGIAIALIAIGLASSWFALRQARQRRRRTEHRQALHRLGLPDEVVNRFLIPDQINLGTFLANYEQYDPGRVSPFYPRWFAAAYPDVIRHFSDVLKTGNVVNLLFAFEREQIALSTDPETGLFDLTALCAFKEYYRRSTQRRRFECAGK